MIKLIVGNKGSGKTKKLVDGVNAAVAKDHGAVVCVEKGLQLTYDLSHKARLVDIETYDISGFDAFYGLLWAVSIFIYRYKSKNLRYKLEKTT